MDSINSSESIAENSFSNQTVNIAELPDFESVSYTPLHPDYLKVMFMIRGINLLVFFGLWLAAFFIWSDYRTEVLYFLFLFVVFVPIFGVTKWAFHRKRFAVREHDVIYKSGLLVHKTVLIPFNRIQHVSIEQGPLMRLFGLAELSIFTAGGMTSDLTISGVKLAEAEKLKAYLSKNVEEEFLDDADEVAVDTSENETKPLNP